MKPPNYFHYLETIFHQVSSPPTTRYYSIGGLIFALHFQHPKLPSIFSQALREAPSRKADFHICIMEAEISPGWTLDQYQKQGLISGFNSAPYQTVYDIGSGILSMANLKEKKAFYCIRNLKKIPYWEKGSPLRNIIHWFLQSKKRYLVHAAAIGHSKQCALIVGKGGRGKSTTALSCLSTSLSYIADDYCVLENRTLPTCYSAYTSAKISPHSKSPLKIENNPSTTEKIVINIAKSNPTQLLTASPIRAIFYPSIKHQKTASLSPIKKSKILTEFALSSIFQLPGHNRDTLSLIKNLIHQLPCYSINLSDDFQKNAHLIEDFLLNNDY